MAAEVNGETGITIDDNGATINKTVNELEELMDRNKGIFPSGNASTRFAELSAQVKSLADAERKVLLRQMSLDLGYGEEDASVVIGTVEDILKATSSGCSGTGSDGSECLFLKIE